MPKAKTTYKPMFEFMRVWDFYPDLSAKTFASMDGWFKRKVMSKSEVIALKKRPDFFAEQIDAFLEAHPTGNYIAQPFEWTFTRKDLHRVLDRLKQPTPQLQLAV